MLWSVGAVTETVIESWDDASPLDEWFDDTGDFTTVTSPSGIIQDGSQALAKPQTGTYSAIVSTTGLPRYPQQGDHLRQYLRSDGTHARVIFFFGDGGSSRYSARLYWTNNGTAGNTLELWKDGTQQASTSTSLPVEGDTTYTLDVHWDDATTGTDVIEAELIETNGGTSLATVSITDGSYAGGYVALAMADMAAGETTYHDYLHVRS